MGGGTSLRYNGVTGQEGLSPRGRGNLSLACMLSYNQWSIPAWAGEPPAPSGVCVSTAVYPRVGGGTTFPAVKR